MTICKHGIWRDATASPYVAPAIAALVEASWPAFITRSPSPLVDRWRRCALTPRLQCLLRDLEGQPIAAISAVTVPDPGPLDALPEAGWDWAVDAAVPPAAAAVMVGLSVSIAPTHRGRGLAYEALAQMTRLRDALGFARLIIPVRPTWKSRHPREPMGQYTRRLNAEGLPEDPWLRVHARVGGRILQPCERSMTLEGSVAQWSAWTGREFPTSGEYTAPGLLAPLRIDRDAGTGCYIEPNVWVAHIA